MAFAGVSLIADGKLCTSTASPVDARADRGYHLLAVEGYSRSKGTPPTGEFISSRPFLVGGYRWCLKYFPSGFKEDYQQFIQVFLHLVADVEEQDEVEAHAVFSFIDQPELRTLARLCKNQKIEKIPPNHYCYVEVGLIRRDVLERSRHLKDDSFVIRCDILVVKGARTASSSFVVMPPPPSEEDMHSHLGDLLLSKEGADVTFEVGGETFAAHRCVLAARSSVFKEQLFGMPKTNDIVKIDDMEPETFSELLIFIYTDSFPDWFWIEEDESGEEEAQDESEKEEEELETDPYAVWLLQLLEAADRYDLQRLKLICEEKLVEYIDLDSVADIIGVAGRRECPGLKDACSEFIKSHTTLYTALTVDSLDRIIRTCSPSVLRELLSTFAT